MTTPLRRLDGDPIALGDDAGGRPGPSVSWLDAPTGDYRATPASRLASMPLTVADEALLDAGDPYPATPTAVLEAEPASRDAVVAPVPQTIKLSVVVPAFNEEATLRQVLTGLLALDTRFEFEVIVVDDGSSDTTPVIAESIADARLKVLRHETNRGKGEALRTGILVATGTHFLPFDADSEYEVADIPRLMEPVLSRRADMVYGARIAGINTLYTSFWYPLGSRLTTLAANVIYGSRLKDMHTCLKLLPLAVMRGMSFTESRFGLDTEMTARFLKMGLRPFEIPVSYHGRSRAQGKKIRWQDGVRCLLVLLRIRFSTSAPSSVPGPAHEPTAAERHAESVLASARAR